MNEHFGMFLIFLYRHTSKLKTKEHRKADEFLMGFEKK